MPADYCGFIPASPPFADESQPPGSPDKILLLQRRADRRENLFDPRDYIPNPTPETPGD
jgi:hypothetical protein